MAEVEKHQIGNNKQKKERRWLRLGNIEMDCKQLTFKKY